MIEALQRKLKGLIGKSQYEEVFRCLKDVLNPQCALYDDTILQEARYSGTEYDSTMGLVNSEEGSLNFNKVSKALLYIINDLGNDDLSEEYQKQLKNHRAIAPEHALTCDRKKQSFEFEDNYYDPPQPGQRMQFYYLYGDTKQEHQSLFQRFCLEAGCSLKDPESGSYEPVVKFLPVKVKARMHPKLKVFKLKTLRDLFMEFSMPITNLQSIHDKTICDLLDTPKLKDFGPDDLVFILITLDDYNWHDKLIPALVRDLYEGFCQGELGENAPQFFFFFGIEYQKDNQPVREQVHRAMKEARYGFTLSELQPLHITDLEAWLSPRRALLESSGKEAHELARELFPGQENIDMADAERQLRILIDRHNKGLVLNEKLL